MVKMFSRAALFSVALMVATAGLGLWLGDLRDQAWRPWGTVHRLSGVFAGLFVVLVNSVAVTYFIGTSRWCREVAEAYGLEAAFVQRARRLKRSAFPLAVVGMLSVVGIVALGGAADTAAYRPSGIDWPTIHLVGATGLVAVIAWCFQSQVPVIRRQQELIDDVMTAVRRERVARGLEV